jgi:hypothetical protein
MEFNSGLKGLREVPVTEENPEQTNLHRNFS